jgi:drug/metabolite transporter (DMT)-like permease
LPSSNRPWFGLLLAIGGSLLLSTKGIIAKFIYAEGVPFDVLTSSRAVLALPMFWVWGWYRLGMPALLAPPAKLIAAAMLAGCLAYYVGMMCDFYALTLIDASLERVILFTYPVLVVIANACITRKLPGGRVAGAALLTYLGVFFVVGGFDAALVASNSKGALFVLVAATTTGTYFIINERLGRRMGSIPFTVYAMTAATVALAVHASITTEISEFSMDATTWGYMAILIVAVTALPLFMIAEGVRLIGAQRAALVSTVGPPATIAMAWVAG